MGLSGRKEKQRIANDPRNLSWADNAAKFGQTYLEKFGWNESQGLGASGSGRTSHIKVSQKLDMLGIGAANQRDPDGIAWKQNKDFENVLKRLNEAKGVENNGGEKNGKRRSEESDIDVDKKRKKAKRSNPEPEASAIVVPKPSTSRPMLHRARSRASKNIASKSASAIAEILGIAPTPMPISTPTPSTPSTLTQIDEDPTMGCQTTSTKSVADYFRERLLAKSVGTSVPSSPKPTTDDDRVAPRAGLGSLKSTRHITQTSLDYDAQQPSKISSFTPPILLPNTDTEVNTPPTHTLKDDTRERERKEKRAIINEDRGIEGQDKRGKKDKKERKKKDRLKGLTLDDDEAKAARKKARAKRRGTEGQSASSS